MSRALWWAGWLWALPVTLAGLLLALVAGKYARPYGGALVFAARDWFRDGFFRRFHVWAFCWGGCIFVVSGAAPMSVLAHELVHFKQARIFGVLLPFVYALGSLIAVANGGHPYRDNFLERWARTESGH